MGEELDLQFYIQTNDGEHIPFGGVTQVHDIVICDEVDEALYASLIKEGTYSFTTRLDLINNKAARKWAHKIMQRIGRRKRYEKRLKEYARRRKLKGMPY